MMSVLGRLVRLRHALGGVRSALIGEDRSTPYWIAHWANESRCAFSAFENSKVRAAGTLLLLGLNGSTV